VRVTHNERDQDGLRAAYAGLSEGSAMATNDDANIIDASTFQKPLKLLAEVLAQKVKREAPSLLSGPGFVAIDLHVLIRQAMYTYDLLFYLNADERRETDPYWRNAYTIVALPLVRNMIDCLYNVTAICRIRPQKDGCGERVDTVKPSRLLMRPRSVMGDSLSGMDGSERIAKRWTLVSELAV
jgi:hypothetical protein